MYDYSSTKRLYFYLNFSSSSVLFHSILTFISVELLISSELVYFNYENSGIEVSWCMRVFPSKVMFSQ